MKNVILAGMMAILALAACQQKKEVTVSVNEGEASVYACPMKCEGETVYAVAGKCPVCGMDLEPVKGGVTAPAYSMNLKSTPEDPVAGQPATLAFLPKLKSDSAAQVPLDVVHEQKVHVIIVSKDLGWYDHIHPQYQADGSYTIQTTFPHGGEYIVFADYHPTGGANQVERKTVVVTGVAKKTETFATQTLTTETDGYQVTLKPQADKLLTNNMNHLGVEVTQNGKPVTNFESIMGAKGHLVIISGDGQKYLHVHPDEVDGKLDLHAQFDQPGIYRAFFQFKTNGKLHTSYFTMDVKEGKPGELGTHEGHSHDDADHEHGEHTHTH